MNKAFRGEWAKEQSTWNARLGGLFAQMDAIPLTILVWGPSPGWSDYYPKRLQIIEHLRDHNPSNDVTTSEELVHRVPQPAGMTVDEVEELHIYAADLIFVLIVRNSQVTGAQAEIVKFKTFREFREKAYLIMPRLTAGERRRAGFLKQGWADYQPIERCFQYNDREYDDCTKIRSFCGGIVDRLRKERGLAQIRQARSSV